MLYIPAIAWTLTVMLLLGGTYHALQTILSRRLTERINQSLHALMHTLMAAMLWNTAPTTTLAQIFVLAAAALWFIIQAVAHPRFKTFCAGAQDRLKCIYHSLTMAAAALMIAMMTHPATPTATSGTHRHHTMTTSPTTTGTGFEHTPALANTLTVLFGTAAAIFLVLLLRHRHRNPQTQHNTNTRNTNRAEHGFEALGAAIMALMFATMTA